MSLKNKLTRKNRDYIVLFILNAAGMILELVASRLMSPYFGNSNFVWTAIIGIILLAGSLGNILGGKISNRRNARYLTIMLLLFAAIYLAVTPMVDAPILSAIKSGNNGVQFSSVISSIVFFLVPATILGIITPIIMKEHIASSKDQGKESGRITAIIAIGSLLGTFAGGFWIIPAIGTRMIFNVLAITIILMVPFFMPITDTKSIKLKWRYFFAMLLATVVTIASIITVNSMTKNVEGSISIDTEYGRVIVEDGTYGDDEVRYYKQSGAYSSATFLSENKKYDLVFNYLKKYDEMFKFLNVKNTAMIGGAAYQYPKYFISHFKDKSMDVIEIDPMSTEIAKNYFFLDDLVRDYDTESTGRLGLYNDDGRIFLADSTKKYDAILNDAFSGEVPVGTLATVEAAKIIKSRLNKDGVYMSNVLGAVSGHRGKFLRAEVKTLKKVFRHVYVMPVYENAISNQYVNWMVIATDNDNYVPKTVDIELTEKDITLTDDYCPIDSLITTEYFD